MDERVRGRSEGVKHAYGPRLECPSVFSQVRFFRHLRQRFDRRGCGYHSLDEKALAIHRMFVHTCNS